MNPKMALGNVGLMVPVMTKRKMPLVPRRAKGAAEVGRIYKKTMERAKARQKAEAETLAKLRAGATEVAGRPAAAGASGHGAAVHAAAEGEVAG